MPLFALSDQQNNEEAFFSLLHLLQLVNGTECVNDEIVIDNRIYRLSTFRELSGTGENSNANSHASEEEYPLITDGQLTVKPKRQPNSKLSVYLNGIGLHIRDDFTVMDDWTVVFPYGLIHNEWHTDLIRLLYD